MESSTATATTRAAVEAATHRRGVPPHRRASTPDLVAFRTDGRRASRLTWAEARERVDAIAGGLAQARPRARRHASRSCSATAPSSTSSTSPRSRSARRRSRSTTRTRPSRSSTSSTTPARRSRSPRRRSLDRRPRGAQGRCRPRARDRRRRRGAGRDCSPLADVEGADPDFDVEAAVGEVEPDDVLTLIYTSGTTGPPKGVQLSHTQHHDRGRRGVRS